MGRGPGLFGQDLWKAVTTSDAFPSSEVGNQDGLRGGCMCFGATMSSQYVSAILMCASYAHEKPVEIKLVGGVIVLMLYANLTIVHVLVWDLG